MWKTTILITALVFAGSLVANQARAEDGPLAEVSFEVGGEAVSMVLFETHGGPPARYYALETELAYEGLEDHRDCFEKDGLDYHHEACPLLTEFFLRHGDRPGRISVSSHQGGPYEAPPTGGETEEYVEEEPRTVYPPYVRPVYSYGHYGAYGSYYRPYYRYPYYAHLSLFFGHGGSYRSYGHHGLHRGGHRSFGHRGSHRGVGHRGGSRGGGSRGHSGGRAVRSRPR